MKKQQQSNISKKYYLLAMINSSMLLVAAIIAHYAPHPLFGSFDNDLATGACIVLWLIWFITLSIPLFRYLYWRWRGQPMTFKEAINEEKH